MEINTSNFHEELLYIKTIFCRGGRAFLINFGKFSYTEERLKIYSRIGNWNISTSREQ